MKTEEKIGQVLKDKGLTISTAESCTGGLLSSKLTDISGSSEYIRLNLVTYANEAKNIMLGVPSEVLDTFGAVSEECAYNMAKGLYELTGSDICVSTTGIAGPTGGTSDKPVGLMYSAIYSPKKFQIYKVLVESALPRIEIKEQFVQRVLDNILDFLD